MAVEKMNDESIAARLSEIPGWAVKNGKLRRELQFADFAAAFRFMTLAARRAEELNHHPEWFNVYSRVNIDLNTHSVQGISELDFRLARSMNDYAAQCGGKSGAA
jgi:4a-hydroxytetrahydrobiopterin dehydratase